MAEELIKVPDIGGAEGADVVEVLVAVGDVIELEQSLIVVESDKASMEIPASSGGTITELRVAVGDAVSEGDVILVLATEGAVTASVQMPAEAVDERREAEIDPPEAAPSLAPILPLPVMRGLPSRFTSRIWAATRALIWSRYSRLLVRKWRRVTLWFCWSLTKLPWRCLLPSGVLSPNGWPAQVTRCTRAL